MLKIIMLLLTVTMLMAFTIKQKESPSNTFYNTKWMLTKFVGPDGAQEISLKKAFIRFDKEKNRAGGNGSCNSFGGSFLIKGDSLSISQLFSTKMYCDAVQKTEDVFFALLQKVNKFEIKKKTLVLYKGKEVLLEFESE